MVETFSEDSRTSSLWKIYSDAFCFKFDFFSRAETTDLVFLCPDFRGARELETFSFESNSKLLSVLT
jgi:hypothetical protein